MSGLAYNWHSIDLKRAFIHSKGFCFLPKSRKMSGNYCQQRLDSQQLFDYSKLGQEMAVNIAIGFADTKHNQLLIDSNWDQMSERLTQEMSELIESEESLNQSIEASVRTETKIQQMISESENNENNSLIAESIDNIFDETLNQIKSETNSETNSDVQNNVNYRRLIDVLSEFKKTVNTGAEEDEDLVTIESQPNRIPLDPFSKTEIQSPVKNKKCHHIYDRQQLAATLAAREAGRKLRCPMMGCNNKSVTMSDVIDDRKTKALIEKIKRNQK